MKYAWRLALVVALLAHSGCGYSLAGRGSFLPAYIKRIGVPQFTNNTAVFELDRQVTERVRTEFIGRGKWTIVPDSTGVDGLVTGVITSVALTPVAFNTAQQATRYALILSAAVAHHRQHLGGLDHRSRRCPLLTGVDPFDVERAQLVFDDGSNVGGKPRDLRVVIPEQEVDRRRRTLRNRGADVSRRG